MQRHEWQRQEQFFLDEIGYADAIIRRMHGLELLRHAVRFPFVSEDRYTRLAFERPCHGSKASLTDQLRFALHLQLRDAKARFTTEMRNSVNRALRACNLGLHARQTTQRNIEGDIGLPVS